MLSIGNNIQNFKNNNLSNKDCFKSTASNNQIIKNNHFNSLRGIKFSPLMFGAKVEQVSQKFGTEERAEIQEVLDNCRYTKLPAILNPENITITENKNSFIVEGFNTPDNEHINGICEELSSKAINFLNKKMKGKGLFALVTGQCPNYTMQHSFIIGFKDTPENREKYEKITGNYKILADEVIPLQQDLMNPEKLSDPDFIEQIQQMIAKGQSLVHNPEDLKDAIIIDPSFGIIVDPDNQGKFKGYQIDSIHKSENSFEINESPFEFPIEPFDNRSKDTVLGYIKEITPELKSKYPESALLFMAFQKASDSKPADVLFYVIESQDELFPTQIENFEKDLPEDHYFRKFTNKIREELRKK